MRPSAIAAILTTSLAAVLAAVGARRARGTFGLVRRTSLGGCIGAVLLALAGCGPQPRQLLGTPCTTADQYCGSGFCQGSYVQLDPEEFCDQGYWNSSGGGC
jgi:hypothetical protein